MQPFDKAVTIFAMVFISCIGIAFSVAFLIKGGNPFISLITACGFILIAFQKVETSKGKWQ